MPKKLNTGHRVYFPTGEQPLPIKHFTKSRWITSGAHSNGRFGGKADIDRRRRHVRLRPKADFGRITCLTTLPCV
jgi:hypothetical protein